MRITVTGSLAYDHILDFPQKFADHIMPDKLHILSVSFLANNLTKNFGGTAGNIGYTLSLLGNKVMIVGSLGKDAGTYIRHLKQAKVATGKIVIDKNDYTANFFVITDRADCQIAGFYPGAMKQDVRLRLPKVTDFLIISPTIPSAMEQFVKEAQKRKLRYLYAPTQQIPRLSKSQILQAIRGAEILVGNDYELALIQKKLSLHRSNLCKLVKVLIITLGEKGSIIYVNGRKWAIPAMKPKKLVDPTGAGDAYIAGFLTGYLAGKSIDKAGMMGALAGTYAIEQYGTQNHQFTSKEYEVRFRKSLKD